MTRTRAVTPTLLYTVIIGICLLGLAFAPKLLRKDRYTLALTGDEAAVPKQFPLDQVFPVVQGSRRFPVSGSVSLKQFLPGPKSLLLVNFWATWCPPCMEEFPTLDYLNRELDSAQEPHSPAMVAISVDEKSSDVLTTFKGMEFSPSVVVLHDPLGQFAKSVGTVKFPETYLVNGEGKVLFKWVGPQIWLSDEVLGRIHRLSRL